MVKTRQKIGAFLLILSIGLIISSSTNIVGFSILENFGNLHSYTSLLGISLFAISLIMLSSRGSQTQLERKFEGTVFNAGQWNREKLDNDILDVNGYLYVAPEEEGAYLGEGARGIRELKPGQEEVLLEIKYSNPYLFVDDRSPIGEIGQEALWVGKNLRLKKINEEMITKEGIQYRHIVATPIDSNDRSVTGREYAEARRMFEGKYRKRAIPDQMSKAEWYGFLDIIDSLKKKGPPTEEES